MKKIIKYVLIVCLFVLLTGCGNTKYKSLGRKNAVKYIEDKYGFKPSVKSVISQKYNGSPLPFSSSSETGYVYVEMKHEDKTFYVFISALSENTAGIDNYQVRDIENAINEKVQDMVTNIINIDYCIGTNKESNEEHFSLLDLKNIEEKKSTVIIPILRLLIRAVISVAKHITPNGALQNSQIAINIC